MTPNGTEVWNLPMAAVRLRVPADDLVALRADLAALTIDGAGWRLTADVVRTIRAALKEGGAKGDD